MTFTTLTRRICATLALPYTLCHGYQHKREPLTPDEANRMANACATTKEKLVIWTLLRHGPARVRTRRPDEGNLDLELARPLTPRDHFANSIGRAADARALLLRRRPISRPPRASPCA